MIDDKVLSLASDYRNYWSEVFREHIKYVPDLSWPSVGVTDMVTYSLRGCERYNDDQFLTLQGAAAYLAGIAYDCWGSFPDKLNIDVQQHPESGEVIITARDGRYLRHGDTFAVSLTQALMTILRDPKQPFPFFESTSRFLEPQHNFLSLFALGLMTGLCPYGEGPWRDRSAKDLSAYTNATLDHLAESSAAYYKRIFPAEELGQNSKLYYARLILPPAMYDEHFPAARACAMLVEYLRAIDASRDRMSSLAFNLASSPDELISSAGFALAVALSETTPSSSLQLLANSKGGYRSQLRPAVMIARKLLDLPNDFTHFYEHGEYEKALPLIAVERQLGLLPLLRLKHSSLGDVRLTRFLIAIAWSLPESALATLKALGEPSQLSMDLLLQSVYLHLVLGDAEQAHKELALCSNGHRPTDTDDLMNLLELKAMLLIREQKTEETASTLREAFALGSEITERYVSVGNFLADTLITLEQYSDAVDVLDAVIKRDDSSITARSNRIMSLHFLGRDEEAKRDLSRLARLSPFDRQIFHSFVALRREEIGF